jgi:hypothetical protein
MPLGQDITFVVAVNRWDVFKTNFLGSPAFRGSYDYQILIQQHFKSAARAYNDAIDRSRNDLMIFAHQDIFFPEPWLAQLARALDYLEVHDPQWGVLGCYGTTRSGERIGHIYSSGLGVIGQPFEHPKAVLTLDEVVLVLRKSSGLRFDETLPHFHFYGTDICLSAAERGMKSYSVPAFCVHNTEQIMVLPPAFYESAKHIRRVWKAHLPIQTSCIRLTKLNLPMFAMRLRGALLRMRRKDIGASRAQEPQGLVH